MSKKNLFKINLFILCVFFIFIFLNKILANQYKRPNRIGIVYWHGDLSQKKIALTFDDGPNELYTRQILDILKKYKVKATFFLIGKNVEAFPLVAKRIAEDGHCIGNHTYTHPDLFLQTRKQIEYQIKNTEDIIRKATGVLTYLFRPPYGVDDHLVFMEAEKLGYIIVKWSLTGGTGESDKIIKKILSYVENGAIILLHDGNRLSKNSNRSQVVKALPVIIESLQKEGYILVTVPELLSLADR